LAQLLQRKGAYNKPANTRLGGRKMKRTTHVLVFWVMAGILILGAFSYAQDKANTNLMKLAAGQKANVSGQITQNDGNGFLMRDVHGMDVMVKMTAATIIKEKKSNPFRGAKNFTAAQLVRGLSVDVEGLGDADGALAARDIRFTQTQYLVANSVESRVTPVEERLGSTESRLARAEENAQHLSGQIQEVNAISVAARSGAKAAQESADAAIGGVETANQRITTTDRVTNARISAVDDFEVKNSATVTFKVGSAALSAEAKTKLDELAKEALAQRGYVVEVTGFASAEGGEVLNRELSQRRADAVVQHLADSQVPLRRIVTPFGFGTKMPVADNTTRTGREQNRRVEVKILISKGLTDPIASTASVPGKSR
jgi:outer membrane protein OmpA-like peptidoglycan-associated protein